MERSRRVWQHEVSDVSVDQLKECFHGDRWVVIDIPADADYEEDFLVRIFHKGNPTRHAFCGSSFYHLGNRKEEIRSFKTAVRIDPMRWEAYSSWAYSELVQGNYARARNLFLRCFAVNPKIEKGGYAQLYSLAYALWRLGDLKEAYRRVTELLSLKPNHHDGRLLKSHVLSRLWRADSQFVADALTFFKSRAIDDSSDMFARGELYLIYNSANYEREARTLIEEAVASSHAPPQALYQYAKLLMDEGEMQKALHYLELAYKQNKGHRIVHDLGRVKQKLGQYRDAIKFYKMALEGVKNPVALLRSIADCYHFLRTYEQCIQYETKALLLEPRNDILWSNVQYSLVQLGYEDVFSVFTTLRDKLRAGKRVANAQVVAAQQELLSRLSIVFGDEFAGQILSNESQRDA
jgi:tetratricopeptide (TPR) repeat protein